MKSIDVQREIDRMIENIKHRRTQMKQQLVEALEAHFSSHIVKHKMNVEIMLNNPMAIHDHTDWMSAVEAEIAQIAEYEDKLEALLKYFKS